MTCAANGPRSTATARWWCAAAARRWPKSARSSGLIKTLRILAFLAAALIAGGEVARWWGQARFVPMAFDELIVAAALAAAAWGAPRWGPAPLAAAWGAFSGLMLALLVPTVDHLLFGEAKESAWLYTALLSAMLGLGLWATLRALRLSRAPGFGG